MINTRGPGPRPHITSAPLRAAAAAGPLSGRAPDSSTTSTALMAALRPAVPSKEKILTARDINPDQKLQRHQQKMFPLSLLQSSHSPLYVCRESPLTIFWQLEDDMMNMRKDLERRMQRVNQAYQLLDMDMRRRTAQSRRPSEGESCSMRKEGKENYELTLDIGGFSPEELTVKTEGRRLIVSGKHDKKKEGEYGGYFHEYREWRREAELPEDVNPDDVLCSLSKDGRLHFQAPRRALPPAQQRPIPITVIQNPVEGPQNPPEIQHDQPNGEQQEGPSSS